MYLHEGTTTMTGHELHFEKQIWIEPYPDIAAALEGLGDKGLMERRDNIAQNMGKEATAIERLEMEYIAYLLRHPRVRSDYWLNSLRAVRDVETSSDIHYDASRAVGEAFERGIVAFLLSLGIPSRRYEQTGIPQKLLRAFQRDIYVRDVGGHILNVELKALKSGSFLRSGVLVGDVGKWNEKRFRVDICLVVHQQTGAILWTDADEQARAKWKLHDNSYGSSYLVPHEAWKPLETLVASLGYVL